LLPRPKYDKKLILPHYRVDILGAIMGVISAEQIDALLPQTQCGQCGFAGCKPYAEAIAKGEAAINQCPPGGAKGIEKLATLLGVQALPLNPEFGVEKPRQIAVINEADCIGCTKCLPPCPVDAIVGASKWVHTVISEACSGCALCVAPCPVNCIVMVDAPAELPWEQRQADLARIRYQRKLQRLAKIEHAKAERLAKQKAMLAKLKKNVS
jgi:electron transport complex protein RnfB